MSLISTDIYSATRDYLDSPAIETIPFGIPYLDKATGGIMANDLIVIGASAGAGKCLGKGTRVLMYDGSYKNVEDIKTGELLMGDDSSPRKVLGTTIGRGPLYKIKPVKGEEWVCNEPHILSLKKIGTQEVLNIPLKDYLQQSKTFKHNYKLYNTGVDFKEQETKIDPYIAGIWIGDGTYTEPSITTSYLQDEIYKYAELANLRVSKKTSKNRTPVYRLCHIKHKNSRHFFDVELDRFRINKEKRIPRNYLINSRNKRLELLAGILDSDGYVDHGGFEVTTKYTGLKDDILFLARSLGFKVTFRKKKSTIKKLNFVGYYWRIFISGDCSLIPTRYKIASKRKQIKDHLKTGFTVEKLGIGDYYGFEIDGNKLFIIEDFCVTHNTSIASTIAKFNAIAGKRVKFYALEAYKNEIQHRIIYQTMAKKNYQRLAQLNITYRDFIQGRLSNEALNMFVSTAKDLNLSLNTLKVDYKGLKDVTPETLVQDMEKSADYTDIYILDHLHYVDYNIRDGENNAIKKLMQKLRNTALVLNKPIIAISHLRKKNTAFKTLLPSLDDFHGSSDITKIATRVIAFAPYSDPEEEHHPYLRDTLVSVLKSRIDGGVKSYVAKMEFDLRLDSYTPNVEIGLISRLKDRFEPLEISELPRWAK